MKPRPDLILERGLPASPDAERWVLGGLLVTENAYPAIAELLNRNDFHLHAHQLIWDAMTNLHERGAAIERMTVAEELNRAGKLEAAGGAAAICELDDGMPANYHLDAYAQIVARKALRRRAIQACQMTQDALLMGDDTPDTLDAAQRTLAKLAEESQGGGDIPSLGQAIQNIGVERLMAPRQNATGSVQLPWPSLAGIIPCLMPGQLILWGARPAQAKTVVGCHVARHAAQAGIPVAVFSLEMRREALIKRMACQIAGVDSYWIDTGLIRKPAYHEQLTALNTAVGQLAELPIYIEDRFVTTVPAIAAKLRRLKAQRGLGLVVVDYLQLLDAVGRVENANHKISQISRALKLLANEFGIPVVALSQLTRSNEKENRPPRISDLRDSGSLDQDADVIVFNHIAKPDWKAPSVDLEMIVAKQREGAVRKLLVQFQRQFTRIVDCGEEYGRP